MIEYLNHKLMSAQILNFEEDLVCINCRVRLGPKIDGTYFIVENYIPNVSGAELLDCNITCEEQQIKNLLE